MKMGTTAGCGSEEAARQRRAQSFVFAVTVSSSGDQGTGVGEPQAGKV